MSKSIEQIAASSANNQAKNQLVEQRTGIEHAQIEIDNHDHCKSNQSNQERAICLEHIKGRATIAGIVKGQVGADQRHLWSEIRWTEMLHHQRLGPLIEADHDNGRE